MIWFSVLRQETAYYVFGPRQVNRDPGLLLVTLGGLFRPTTALPTPPVVGHTLKNASLLLGMAIIKACILLPADEEIIGSS
jgi:hypothetical protein